RLTRRRFMIGTAVVVGGGLTLTWLAGGRRGPRLSADAATLEPNSYLQVRPDGDIVLQVDKLEMGQGVITGFVTLVAEELGVPPASITTQDAPVLAFFQDPSQTTAESQSMRTRWNKLREVGAAAREMLVQAAAERWSVDVAEVEIPGDATLVNRGTGAVLSYFEVTEAAARLDPPRDVTLKAKAERRLIGRHVDRVDVPAKVTGEAIFGSDIELPGQLIAIVVRCPNLGGELLRADTNAAEAAPGVRHVLRITSGIAIVAETFWHAQQAARLLDTEWSPGPLAAMTTGKLHDLQRATIESGELIEAREDDGVDEAFDGAARVIDAEYALPHMAHATMETMTATMRLEPGRCEIWTGSQSPDLTREVVAGLTGLPRDDVRVHVPFAGCGFGRRFMNDFVVEVTEIAMRIDAPVKLIWSREDDIRHDYYHCANLHVMRAALDDRNRPVGWEHRLVAPSMNKHIMPTVLASVAPEWLADGVHETLADWMIAGFEKFVGPWQAFDGSTNLPYDVGPVRVGVQGLDTGIPAGIWRSVGNHFNAFVVESFIDELANLAGEDPVDFRLRRLGEDPRRVAVLERLAQESGWGRAGPGRHQGVAVYGAYEGAIGQVAEVSVDGGELRVHRVACVVDCGTAINPDIVRQQIEGGIIFGMTAALYGEIDFVDGRVRQSNFHDYRMVRMADSPSIDVHIIDSDLDPGGIGEAGTPPIAPAIANAVFAATGKRIRKLPLAI
ncbi:MAG: molybdopterin-dependent oxidoreductase, partial [Gammaproteobacteria bacterium]|nr:molybdopterin-dependent oxidoreductase [Gammaproteobacteria bacterium]